MKIRRQPPLETGQPTDADIREKAHEIYMRSGWVHGRDLDNWLEAEAELLAQRHGEGGRFRFRSVRPQSANHDQT